MFNLSIPWKNFDLRMHASYLIPPSLNSTSGCWVTKSKYHVFSSGGRDDRGRGGPGGQNDGRKKSSQRMDPDGWSTTPVKAAPSKPTQAYDASMNPFLQRSSGPTNPFGKKVKLISFPFVFVSQHSTTFSYVILHSICFTHDDTLITNHNLLPKCLGQIEQ